MAFLDKLNHLASAATEKASGAIEIGKLNIKLNAEEKRIDEATSQIGSCLLRLLDAGQPHNDEAIMALYEEIKSARSTIASIYAELSLLSGNIVCPGCTTNNPPNSKFCRECGSKLAAPEAAEEIETVHILCPSCGALVGTEEHFCTQCGTKLN